MEELMTAWQC